jgi:hypothetical protein
MNFAKRAHTQRYKALFVSLVIVMLLVVSHSVANAQTSAADINNLGKCGTSAVQFSDTLQHVSFTGDVYIRLSNNTETTAPVTTYFQSYQEGACHEIGTVTPQYGQWTKLGSYSGSSDQSGSLVMIGTRLGAAPYAAVAQLLVLPDPTLCMPTQDCSVTYEGYKATLQPQQISTATDQIAVYVAQPIQGVGYSKVSYYADSTYLYSGTALKPFNRNYLPGGIHTVTTTISLKNGDVLNSDQKIDMGGDPLASLVVKSFIYRSHNKALLFVGVGLIVITFVTLLGAARFVYKRRRYKINHGLNHLSEQPAEDNTDSENTPTHIGPL